jgi:hypothetical protein
MRKGLCGAYLFIDKNSLFFGTIFAKTRQAGKETCFHALLIIGGLK